MKTVYTSDKLPHIFAHLTQDHARISSGHLRVDGNKIYHYSTCLGRVLEKGICVILNTTRYSVTTSKVQRNISYGVNHYKYVFKIDSLKLGTDLNVLPFDLNGYYMKRACDYLAKAKLAKKNAEHYTLCALAHIERIKELNEYFKTDFSIPTVESLQVNVEAILRQRKKNAQLAKEHEKNKVLSKIDQYLVGNIKYEYFSITDKEKRHVSKELWDKVVKHNIEQNTLRGITFVKYTLIHGFNEIEFKQQINTFERYYEYITKDLIEQFNATKDKFLRDYSFNKCNEFVNGIGGIDIDDRHNLLDLSLVDCGLRKKVDDKLAEVRKSKIENWMNGYPTYLNNDYTDVYVRNRNGIVETSKGATMDYVEAKKLFDFVIKLKGHKWHSNNFINSYKFGHYTLDSVDEIGINVGCHKIKWNEIERFARSQNWVKETVNV